MTFWETVERGEYVMIALAVILIVVVIILWARCTLLRKWGKTYGPLMARLRDQVTEGDIDNARQLCSHTPSPGAAVLEAGLKHVGDPMPEIRSAMQTRLELEKPRIEKGVIWLQALAVISPLLGLGGTLVGVIDRLRDLGESPVPVDIGTVCSQIAPTIVTTVAGLSVGICALLAMAILNSCINGSKTRIDGLSAEFADLLNEPS